MRDVDSYWVDVVVWHVMCSEAEVYGVGFFFFKQKTAYDMGISDWSSDVCSSDLKLLQLCAADIMSMISDGLSVEPNLWRQLCGLPLLYTQNNSVATIPVHESQALLTVGVTQSSMFARLKHRVVHPDLVNQVPELFALAPFHRHCHVVPFNVYTLSLLLAELLPPEWKGAAAVQWDPELPGHPSRALIFTLWQEVSFSDPMSISNLKDWPLIPIEGNMLLSCAFVSCMQVLQTHSPAELQACRAAVAAAAAADSCVDDELKDESM